MSDVYHLALRTEQLEGAASAFLPGDPDRVAQIARVFDARARELAWKREYCTWLGYLQDKPVLVTSTGIGGPSTSIAIEELAQLGVRTFIRVGTTGAIQADIEIGTVIITTGAVRLEGASRHYAPLEYPAVAHHEVLQALVAAAVAANLPFRVGVTATSDTFYPGQERYDSFSRYVLRPFQGQTEELRRLGVLNYEMEAALVLTMGSVLGLRAGCVTGVVVNRARDEKITPDDLTRGEENAVQVAVTAMRRLLLQ